MKAKFSNLNCPHCGSKKFKIIKDDIFLCEYCDQKFNFDLDELDFSSDDKIFREELIDEFYKKLYEINTDKCKYKSMLLHYSKLSNNNKFSALSVIGIIVSFIVLLSMVATVFAIILMGLSIAGLIFSIKINKTKSEKYSPYSTYFASKIVECDEQIAVYTKLISKLTI